MARYARPLSQGDTIRVICPSDSLNPKKSEKTEKAVRAFEQLGLKVEFGKHCFDSSATTKQKLSDLHAAFSDKNVSGIFTGTGGFSSNQVLNGINYKLIKYTPKIFCGYSDITVLLNAIYVKTGLATYHGPNFNGVGSTHGQIYTQEYFKKCLMSRETFSIKPAEKWYDKTYCDCHDDGETEEYNNDGWWPINQTGIVEGTLIGGNLSCLSLLQGTEYFPKLAGSVLLIEADQEVNLAHFKALLNSLTQQKGFSKIQGIIIGRFQSASGINRQNLEKIVDDNEILKDMSIIANVDFGHTNPKAILPIGGVVQLTVLKDRQEIKIVEH